MSDDPVVQASAITPTSGHELTSLGGARVMADYIVTEHEMETLSSTSSSIAHAYTLAGAFGSFAVGLLMYWKLDQIDEAFLPMVLCVAVVAIVLWQARAPQDLRRNCLERIKRETRRNVILAKPDARP